MVAILKNQSGNIALAMLLVVIGAMSGLSISSMSVRDTVAAQAELVNIQSTHLLRSEAYRGQAFLESRAMANPSLGGGFTTPMRKVEVVGSHFSKTYSQQSFIYRTHSSSEAYVVDVGGVATGGITGAGSDEYLVKSLITSKSGIGQATQGGDARESTVRKYSELVITQKTSPIYMYFSDNDASPNDTNVYFYGYDVINGPLHSNSNIRIKQAGGGNNSNWPTFMSLVTTAGVVISTPSEYPEDLVFRGGLVENYQEFEFPSELTAIRANGRRVGPMSYDPNNIVIVNVAGQSYNGWVGKVQTPHRAFTDVWPTYTMGYPYNEETNPPSYRNIFTIADTLWVPLPSGSLANTSAFVNAKLWIKGNFLGKQTWGSADTLCVIGDILIDGTTPPNDPYPDNRASMVGLLSEKSILLKYGYVDPADSMRIHTNMGSDSASPVGGVWIYAALAAMGDGAGNPHKDGVFSFEYQHPHGSIPTTKINIPVQGQVAFNWIDLRRNHWPQTSSNPWPAWLDYPWYNPLWPERSPYLERGTINIWGGISQRRRGFVHRNYLDNEYVNNGVWKPEIDFCGGTSAKNATTIPLYANPNVQVTLITRDFPGAVGSGTGYKKNYNYDRRMYTMKPPDWPRFKKQGDKEEMEHHNWVLKRPPRALI